MTRTYVAIHRHDYGTDFKVFRSDDDVMKVWMNVQTRSPDLGDAAPDDPDEEFPVVAFARRINIDFEPWRDEELTIEEMVPTDFDIVSFADLYEAE